MHIARDSGVQLGTKVCIQNRNLHIPTSLAFTQLNERTRAAKQSKTIDTACCRWDVRHGKPLQRS